MRNIVPILVILIAFQNAMAQDTKFLDKAEDEANRIITYTPYYGVWEGEYHIEYMPHGIEPADKGDSAYVNGVELKVAISTDNIQIWFKHSEKEEWRELTGKKRIVGDNIGWSIYVERSGGLWREKYWITFTRIEQNTANVSVTRTVHNWSGNTPEGYLAFFSVFGIGQANKI